MNHLKLVALILTSFAVQLPAQAAPNYHFKVGAVGMKPATSTAPTAPVPPTAPAVPETPAVPEVPKVASFAALSSSASFAATALGYSSSATVTARNNGTASGSIPALTLSGAAASDFSASSNCQNVAVGASCSITVNFTPSAAGSRAAQLAAGTSAVSLSGAGTSAALTILHAAYGPWHGATDNLTSALATFCGTSVQSCTFKPLNLMGDPYPYTAKDLSVQYQCGSTVKTYYAGAEAGTYFHTISCN